MTSRDLTRFPDAVHVYDGVDAVTAETIAPGILSIDYGGSPLDILHRPRGADTTLVIFHTALPPRVTTYPVFSGLALAGDLSVNVVSVSDPVLSRSPDLKLGWFAGADSQPLQRDLPRVLDQIFAAQGCRNIIFFGASGGGFAAMYYSRRFPGSLAIPVNPQVVLKDYNDEALLAYARAAFGARDLDEARRLVRDNVAGDLRPVYDGELSNTVAYMQNTKDSHHLYRHLTHFLRAVSDRDRIHLLLDDWGQGHVPPPRWVLRAVLRECIASEGRWATALDSLGFVRGPSPAFPVDVREGRALVPGIPGDLEQANR
ncbi:hypothetical protein [Cellulomonas fimi]|uniref:Uncharacterized protein n=1 Tax=Cellulomonas fimi TaxID=1708 RepID=A0A7Y0LYI1_CELFI|nr:hypothetical protein [Cellulomonas fimi]NMR20528.1 hypothetical protein [Cellulomonas fimi]